MDTCGTGGDGKSCMNVSSAVSLMLASLGYSVVKHGNKAQSGKVGSADILERIGVPIAMSLPDAEEYFQVHNYVFLFAPGYHPALKHVGQVRKQLRVPTVFNILGPLLNPADPDYQIMGVGIPNFLDKLAEVVKSMNKKRFILYASLDGYDEVSTKEPTDCFDVQKGKVEKFVIDPSLYFTPSEMPVVKTPEEAELMFLRALSGSEEKLVNLIALNTALSLKCLGDAEDIGDGFNKAKDHIKTGRVMEKIKELKGD